jgi:glycosyltransferase involved in cell wall biosynthesis
LKILYTTSYKREEPNGIAVVSFQLADAMSEINEVAMICSGSETHIEDDSGYPTLHIQSAGDKQLNMHNFTSNNLKAIFDFIDDFDPDIVHTHVPADIGLVCQIWAVNNSVPYVNTCHALPSKASRWMDFGGLALFPRSWITSISLNYYKSFLKSCDAVVALNSSIEKELEELDFPGRVLRIPNAVDIGRLQSAKMQDIREKPIQLLFIGSVHPRKNQLFLVEVMKYLPREGFELHLIGQEQNEDYSVKLHKKVEELNLDNIHIHGIVDYERIPDFVEKAHFFVSASLFEVQSIAIIEALASGTPVLGLSNETMDELVDDSCGFNVSQTTKPEAFAKRVKSMAKLDVEEYEDLSRNARKKVKDLDWASIAERSADKYRGLLKSRESATADRVSAMERIISLIPSREAQKRIKNDLYIRLGKKKQKRSRASWVMLVWAFVTVFISVLSFFFIKAGSREKSRNK